MKRIRAGRYDENGRLVETVEATYDESGVIEPPLHFAAGTWLWQLPDEPGWRDVIVPQDNATDFNRIGFTEGR